MRWSSTVRFLWISLLCASPIFAQSPNGTINGIVFDPEAKAIPNAEIIVINDVTGIKYATATNGEGIYALPNLPPGPYRIQVSKIGFKTLVKPDIVLNVQDALSINFTLPLGAVSETVTVQGGAPLINTESAAVSTVVDRQFAENLPLNGRSFQTLIQITPGVVPTASNPEDNGQFSVNGQRATSNYWMVDGVSGNIGVGVSAFGSAGSSLGGALGSFSAQGGTNSLVSVDALQEFRIQTSTYAPEFGRTPGAQISIATRPGTNKFHAALFDYFRNDILDANDWFANQNRLPKPEERQNDFGGTSSGRILKDQTFFFVSYEGLRLRLPQVAESTVPDRKARQTAIPALQSYFNAFPLPTLTNGQETELLDPQGNATGAAKFSASYSSRSSLDAYSIRLDHKINNRLSLFGRYNYSPSETDQRPGPSRRFALSTTSNSRITIQTVTLATNWAVSPQTVNDFRFNYSRAAASGNYRLDNFGGAVPLPTLPLPGSFSAQDALFQFTIFSLAGFSIDQGINGGYLQRQYNFVDNISFQKNSHSVKLGLDFRRLSPAIKARTYSQTAAFFDMGSAETGSLGYSYLKSRKDATLLFRNLGLFVQDSWRINPRLMVTYGLRWDVDFAPSSITGPNIPAVTGFNLGDFSNLALAPGGEPPFKTPYGGFAPRIGLAYQLSGDQKWGRVLRGGFGVFYDLATEQTGNILLQGAYPFGASKFNPGGSFPLSDSAAMPPTISPPGPATALTGFDPNLQLPYTLQWNVAFEQSLGEQQTVTASYIGSAGKRLTQSTYAFSPNPGIGSALLIGNTATSNYNALQLQFQRRLSQGLQVLASYTWAHSIDTASAGSAQGNLSNALVPTINPNANRGPSDFDIRNAFTAAVTYRVPVPRLNSFTNAILRGWSLQSVIQARSAPPVDIYNSVFYQISNGLTNVRPDLVRGVPLYIYGEKFPGHKAFNAAAFTNPPTDVHGNPLRQGNLGRNALRGFGSTQWDFAVHRDFPIWESVTLQFRAEMFNILNHPNLGPPIADLSNGTQFGQSTQMLGRSYDQSSGAGGFSALYQIGGPRSIQLALKLLF